MLIYFLLLYVLACAKATAEHISGSEMYNFEATKLLSIVKDV